MQHNPQDSRPTRSTLSRPILLVTGVLLVTSLAWMTEDYWSGTGDPVTQGDAVEDSSPPDDGGAKARIVKGDTQPGEPLSDMSDKGRADSPPRASAADLAMSAQEKKLTDVIHEPASQPSEILKAMEALLSDPRLADAGMSAMIDLLPQSVADKDLAIGLMALAKKYPSEPYGTSLTRVFDGSGDTDLKLASLKAIEAHRQFGFSDAELQRMRRDSSDSMVADEIDRMLAKRKR